MKRAVLFVPLILFALMVGLFFVMLEHDPSELELAREGEPFPVFSLSSLHDGQQVLSEQDIHRLAAGGDANDPAPLLVNVWATWCAACRVEHPELMYLADQGVRIIGLNYKDDRVAALQWLERYQDPYEFVIFDPDGRLGLDLGVYGAPETYLVSAEGVLLHRHVGVVDQKVWNEKLLPILEAARS